MNTDCFGGLERLRAKAGSGRGRAEGAGAARRQYKRDMAGALAVLYSYLRGPYGV